MEDIETEDTTPEAEAPEEELDTSEAEDEAVEAKEEEKEEQPQEEDENAKKLARFAHEAREAKKLMRQMRIELDQLRGQRPAATPDEELERKVEERAAAKAREAAFADLCNTVYDKGVKQFGKSEMDDVVKGLSEHTQTVIPPVLIEAAADAGNAPGVLKYLYDNPDVYDELLNMPIHRMGAKVATLAAKLEAKAKPQVSKAPPPIKTVSGRGKAEPSLEDMPIEEFVKLRDKQELARRGRL